MSWKTVKCKIEGMEWLCTCHRILKIRTNVYSGNKNVANHEKDLKNETKNFDTGAKKDFCIWFYWVYGFFSLSDVGLLYKVL